MFRINYLRNWLFLLSAVALLAIGWSCYLLIVQPYVGISWSFTHGSVFAVDPGGPADGKVNVGDRITAVDGIPVYEARSVPIHQAGDQVPFTLERQAGGTTVMVEAEKPPLSLLAKRLSIIPIAIAFWLLGLIVLAYGEYSRLVRQFFIACQVTAITLALGAISSFAPAWSWRTFGLLLWWVGPLAYHNHLALTSWKGFLSGRKAIISMYMLALLFTLIDMNRLRLIVLSPIWSFKYIWLGISILASAGVLIYTALWGPPAEQKRTKIAGVSAVAAFLPIVFFSLIPEALTGQFTLSYEITLLALLILPLGYSYSILQHRLVKMEREISQSAAFALATFAIFIIFSFLYRIFTNSFSLISRPYSILEIVAVLALVLSTQPMHKALSRWLYLIFYGGWVDSQGAVKRISEDLKYVTGDTYSIAETLCQTLQRTLLLEYVHLLLSDGRLIKTYRDNKLTGDIISSEILDMNLLFRSLQVKTNHEQGSGAELIDFLAGEGMDTLSILGPKPQLWLLFGGRSNWQGLLVLGSKRGRGDFETKDLEILEVVLRQAGAALENERLLEEVQQRSNQVRELNRKARWTLEVERKRIARDLHDIVIQTLVGINFQLANVRARNDPETSEELENIRTDLHDSLVELRGICADLRPPALDALGLVPALEARITEIKSQVPFEVHQRITDLSTYEIRDDVALCIYRFMQEAMFNIQKHSEANTAIIDLQVDEQDGLLLSIEDDGQGFRPPDALEVLVSQQHFGLIGLQEQVEAVGGRMAIESEVGKGCRLWALIPLKPGQVFPQLAQIENNGEKEI